MPSPTSTKRQALSGLAPDEISATLDLPAFRGKQIFRWVHAKKVLDLERMTDLSKALRSQVGEQFAVPALDVVREQVSPRTGTKKSLARMADGEQVESVLIRDKNRVTLCLSSQAGCPLKCSFCATGAAGYRRNLGAGEIAEQALHLLATEELDGTPNIVYMGMGEPMWNYDNVAKSIRLLMHPDGLGIGARKITVSTAGDVRGIERFADEAWQVRLSVSLHAADDALRDVLVPLNRKYPLARLRDAVVAYQERSGRQITFEWTLLDGVNDQPEHADLLTDYMRGLKATVNLIPWNPVDDLPYRTAPIEHCIAFRDRLTKRGIVTTLRAEKGQDIDAACGQLREVAQREAGTA